MSPARPFALGGAPAVAPLAPRAAPAAGAPGPLELALAARLARCREHIADVTSRACETSEREVLATGSAIDAIFCETKEQTDELGRAAEALDGERGVHRVAELIAGQSELCDAFLSRLAAGLREQDEQTARARALTASIAEAGHVIRDVADQTRILTVNALIEAAHLGEQGRSVAVIAKEMGELSKAVRDANARITTLVQALVSVLPALAERSRRLVADSDEFSDRANRGFGEARATSDALGAMVSDSIATRERRLRRVLALSQGALSSLQFQDPMAQELRALGSCLGGLETEVLDAVAAARSGDESGALVLQHRPEAEDDQGEIQALDGGEVLLFPMAHLPPAGHDARQDAGGRRAAREQSAVAARGRSEAGAAGASTRGRPGAIRRAARAFEAGRARPFWRAPGVSSPRPPPGRPGRYWCGARPAPRARRAPPRFRAPRTES